MRAHTRAETYNWYQRPKRKGPKPLSLFSVVCTLEGVDRHAKLDFVGIGITTRCCCLTACFHGVEGIVKPCDKLLGLLTCRGLTFVGNPAHCCAKVGQSV